ncbi:hypothetical protein ASG25_15305 [Rhizobium sp. Leaf384]|nr:hypothetical protein ASG58_12735 [Rhizobium sp. Leaf383]KQS77916.1 hypothetical protein ASG25_15305 [Rhizobium sp. Leaf384]
MADGRARSDRRLMDSGRHVLDHKEPQRVFDLVIGCDCKLACRQGRIELPLSADHVGASAHEFCCSAVASMLF